MIKFDPRQISQAFKKSLPGPLSPLAPSATIYYESSFVGVAVSITLLSGPSPGLVVWRFRRDWRGFNRLVIDLENPTAAALPLQIHVRDRTSSHHAWDRFNAAATLAPGARRQLSYALADIQAAPAGRTADLARMSVVAIHRTAGDANRFLLYRVALE